jgi:drug/metabolite transporter (DMT)-like permease
MAPWPHRLDWAGLSQWLAQRPDRRGYVLVLAATLFWSTSGTFIRLITQTYTLSAWTLAFWRDTLSFAALLVICLSQGQRLDRVARRDWPRLATLGAISIGIFHVLWATAVVVIPVAVATVLNYTAPFFVVLWSWWVWRQRPSRRQVTALLLAFVGCLLVTGAYRAGAQHLNWPGLLVGLSTGVTYAGFTLLGKPLQARYSDWIVLTYAFGFGALTILLLRPSAPSGMWGQPLGAWLWMTVLVFVSTVGGFGLYLAGLRSLSASTASITATLEPVMAAALAFVLLGELIAPAQMLGGLLVIGAVSLLSLPTHANPIR